MTKTIQTGDWRPAQIKKLKKAKTPQDVATLASLWNADLPKLRARWYYEKGKVTVQSKDVGDEIVLQINKDILTPRRNDTTEVARYKRAVDKVMPELEPNGGNIAIPTKIAPTIKRHLEETYRKNKFSTMISKKDGKPTGFTLFFKRS